MAKQERAIATREALITAAGKVFARLHFESARVADVLEESSVTQGAFYFHFPEGKKQVAEVLIRRQDEQFIQLRDSLASSGLDGLSAILALSDALGQALRSDPVAQAGIRLVTQASTTFPGIAKLPDPAWVDAISAFLYQARGEGNLREGVDVPQASRAIVYMFTGAQMSSFVNDAWSDLPSALRDIEPFVLRSLAVDDFVPQNRSTQA
ncbi:TetR/AcrR family transcriptional regulator [Microbacterium nymphoidis]|uniref:TetR/AcrR family transcriptional regulator n=1 Tax=Microbacterium nymphoidis TaxID=2898586 RepID=UPI001E45E7AE|nr:TetR/AcrR family transcriptional regulator [Microbacterium nymphoidis]MCD2498494.1 TetR/AcrR family transcriptional regulator [Microbacterium nymphoidis]